jgi:3'(2'),5'-bisphosphate nucleotidase
MSLDAIVAIACEAGREIHRIWKAGFDVHTKEDGSPVTIADRHAEAIILAGLARIAPDIPVVAEEEVAAGAVPAFSNRFFLVDPLDGTKGFSEGANTGFTVNIGLIENSAPTLGVIYAPATGGLWAAKGATAWRSSCDPVAAQEITPRTPLHVAQRTGDWRIVGSATFSGPKLKAFAARAGATHTVAESSSIKFCRLASGEADLYPRFGGLCEWDCAAGHAILRAAGGDMMGLDGAPIPYGRREARFELDGLVAWGGSAAEAAARRALSAG